MAREQAVHSPSALRDDVHAMLVLHDVSSVSGSLGRFLIGLGVCLGVGVVVASLITGCLVALVGASWIGWTGWFLVYVLVLTPVLILHERGHREDYQTNALEGMDPHPSSRGEYEMNNSRIVVGMYSSILVWGPRSLIDGLRGLRGRRTVLEKSVIDRATSIATDLARVEGGVEIRTLLKPPEDMRVFGAAIDKLEAFGWIGKSSDGRSVWLHTLWRRKIAERRAPSA